MLTFEPVVWTPLERLAKTDPRIIVGDFMFMGTAHGKESKVHLYKHVSTRRYINLDDSGGFWVYIPATDNYLQTHNFEAVIQQAITF